MTTYVMRDGALVEKSAAEPLYQKNEATHVISDTMSETRHMASGKYFTSKKKFRDETRAYGCVEVGNEAATLLKPRKRVELDRRSRREAIRRALHEFNK